MSVTSKPNTSGTEAEADIERLRRYWIADNPGALAAIAKEFNLSRSFVGDVFRGRERSAGLRVESRLAELNAPGFANSQPAA